LEGEDHELAERLAETEQSRHRLQAARAATEATHQLASRRLEVAEEALRQAEQEHARSQARADALERALDEARGAAGAELLAGVDGVVGTLLDLVEVDSGWEEAFEAAAGASLAAVVISGSEPARAALSRLRQGGATGAVLALTESGSPRASLFGPATPDGTESIRGHVRPRAGGRHYPGLDGVLDTLLHGSCCATRGWSEAIDLALARPDLVVVTRDGDRFSSTGWRVRAGGGVVTAAVVDEARERAELARGESSRVAEDRTAARGEVESTRDAAAEALRADDRNEVAHQAARVGHQRVSGDRDLLATELEDIRRSRAELDDRIGRDATRVGQLVAGMPALEQGRVLAAERVASAREERRRIEGLIAEVAAARNEWEVRTAGLVERRNVLNERLSEVERRLTGHAEERQQAAERRTRLEADATAVERLLAVVAEAQSGLDSLLSALRDRHRRQLEAELAAIGPVNPLAMEELSELGERHQFLESQVEDVRKAQRELRQVIRTLDEEIMHAFDSAFADVNEHFSTLITSLFPGGTGRLSLTDPENLLDTGVEVEVRPAGRNVRRLSLLSGGERSLVAMAYLFAVFRSRPSPFYLMDEVEAALDDVNLMRFLALVNEFRDEAQLIIVSHQKRTMEAADALYGVTMAPGGSSKVVSQKVPRDRTAVDTLGARPTTKVDVVATAPVVVPELGNGAGPSDVGVGDPLTSAAVSGPPSDLSDGQTGTVPDGGSHAVTEEVTEASTDEVTDGAAERGSDDESLAHLADEPEHGEGPVIPVPPRRVDVGGSATDRGDLDTTSVTDR
jgi:chromosome segregation protein